MLHQLALITIESTVDCPLIWEGLTAGLYLQGGVIAL